MRVVFLYVNKYINRTAELWIKIKKLKKLLTRQKASDIIKKPLNERHFLAKEIFAICTLTNKQQSNPENSSKQRAVAR